MSTNANLPEGFTITSIHGKRCTQVPRSRTTIAGETSIATTTSESAAQTTISTTPPPEPTTSSTQVQGNSPQVSVSVTSSSSVSVISSSSVSVISPSSPSVTSTSSAIPTSSIATPTPEPAPETTTSTTPPPAAATTSVAAETVTPAATSSTSTSETSTSASPASKATTPTLFSSTSIPIPQSEISVAPTSTRTSNDGVLSLVSSGSSTSITATTASAHAEESSAGGKISSNPKLTAAPVVGGVIGGIALVGLLGLILWFFRRRRRRDSLLMPLATGTREKFYEIDRGSVGPTKPLTKWRAAMGYQGEKVREVIEGLKTGVMRIADTLKSKISGDRSDVNLNRGNSQFLDGPIPQHSRNNSSVLSNHTGQQSVKDRFQNWWEQFTQNVNIGRNKKDRQSRDLYASARSMNEKQAAANRPPDFSQLLGMEERELQLQAERRRASLSHSYPGLGGLGLDFSTETQITSDPFADHPVESSQPWTPPNPNAKPNPFVDPITTPQPSIAKPNNYISDIRRSRGLSMDTTPTSNPFNTSPNLPSTATTKTISIAPTSRYPSTVAPSRDSYRDTVFSSFSTGRKGKGRSDPFDLERPDLWRPKNPSMPQPIESTIGLYHDSLRTQVGPPAAGVGGAGALVVGDKRIVSEVGTYGSKYSSGMSSLGGWGDPGPDVVPGSVGSGYKGLTPLAADQVYGAGSQGIIKGSLAEMSPTGEWRRDGDAVSLESSRGGVGKAM